MNMIASVRVLFSIRCRHVSKLSASGTSVIRADKSYRRICSRYSQVCAGHGDNDDDVWICTCTSPAQLGQRLSDRRQGFPSAGLAASSHHPMHPSSAGNHSSSKFWPRSFVSLPSFPPSFPLHHPVAFAVIPCLFHSSSPPTTVACSVLATSAPTHVPCFRASTASALSSTSMAARCNLLPR